MVLVVSFLVAPEIAYPGHADHLASLQGEGANSLMCLWFLMQLSGKVRGHCSSLMPSILA